MGTVVLKWRSFDGTRHSISQDFELQGQRKDIDWSDLSKSDPYRLEPVSNEADLVGRSEILNDLISRICGPSVGSFFIYGQKRVGKTSVAKTLNDRLLQESTPYHFIYLEGGDYVHPDARTTISFLGLKL